MDRAREALTGAGHLCCGCALLPRGLPCFIRLLDLTFIFSFVNGRELSIFPCSDKRISLRKKFEAMERGWNPSVERLNGEKKGGLHWRLAWQDEDSVHLYIHLKAMQTKISDKKTNTLSKNQSLTRNSE